jgi:hypothetical protein
MADELTAKLGMIRAMAEAASVTPEAFDLSVLTGHTLALVAATEATLELHQDFEGRCTHCRESCTCIEDALPEAGHMMYPAQVHKAAWDGWANCPHGNEPWPCAEYRAITTALLGEVPDAS